MKTKTLFFTACILTLFCLITAASPGTRVFASEVSETTISAPDAAENDLLIITGIYNDTFLQSWPEEIYEAGDAGFILENLSNTFNNSLRGYVGYTEEMVALDFSLDVGGSDLSAPGSYMVTVSLLAPEGYRFAEGVMQSFTIPVRVKDVSQTFLITSISNQHVFDRNYLVSEGDVSTWKIYQDALLDYLTWSYGTTEEGESADLELVSFDDSSLDLSTPGDYVLTASLAVSESFSESFALSEDLQELKIRVRVSLPSDFDLVFQNLFSEIIQFSYLGTYYPDVQIFGLDSEEALDEDTLDLSDFQALPETESLFASNGTLTIRRNGLELNRHYYFCLYDGIQYSTIIHFVDDGSSPSYTYLGGDRDGGDTDGNRPSGNPGTELPSSGSDDDSSSEPDTGSKATAGGTGSAPDLPPQAASANEEVSGNKSVSRTGSDTNHFSGAELRRMLEIGENSLRFSGEGILAVFPNSLLSDLSIGDSDTLEVRLNWNSESSFDFQVRVNDHAVSSIPESTLMIPYTASSKEASVCLIRASGETVSEGSRSSSAEVYSFRICETGTFTIQERLSAVSGNTAEIHTDNVSNLPSDPISNAAGSSGSGGIRPSMTVLSISSVLACLSGGVCHFLFRRRKKA